MFILPTRVRPINVGFSNRFFCLSDKRFLIIIIKKKFDEDKSKGEFFSAENCVFGGGLDGIGRKWGGYTPPPGMFMTPSLNKENGLKIRHLLASHEWEE